MNEIFQVIIFWYFTGMIGCATILFYDWEHGVKHEFNIGFVKEFLIFSCAGPILFIFVAILKPFKIEEEPTKSQLEILKVARAANNILEKGLIKKLYVRHPNRTEILGILKITDEKVEYVCDGAEGGIEINTVNWDYFDDPEGYIEKEEVAHQKWIDETTQSLNNDPEWQAMLGKFKSKNSHAQEIQRH